MSLSSSPPSSTKNVDGVRPANMLVDLPGKKSQLDLKLFSVGVLVVGRIVSPWPQLHSEECKISLLVERVWHA